MSRIYKIYFRISQIYFGTSILGNSILGILFWEKCLAFIRFIFAFHKSILGHLFLGNYILGIIFWEFKNRSPKINSETQSQGFLFRESSEGAILVSPEPKIDFSHFTNLFWDIYFGKFYFGNSILGKVSRIYKIYFRISQIYSGKLYFGNYILGIQKQITENKFRNTIPGITIP